MANKLLDKSQLVGITESSEIAFNLDVFDHLYDANIIITKRLTNALIEKLVENKDKVILHLTCTGFGGTALEPFVPEASVTRRKLQKLLDGGFPIEHVVLRIDPCIPTEKGIETMRNVVELFSDIGIRRVRFSVLDMYEHVKRRFSENGLPIPYDTFHAPLEKRLMIRDILAELGKVHGFEVEACGEPGIDSVSCLSQKDIDILGMTDKITLVGSAGQRGSCGCPSNKKELIQSENRAKKCPSGCLYCFWRD